MTALHRHQSYTKEELEHAEKLFRLDVDHFPTTYRAQHRNKGDIGIVERWILNLFIDTETQSQKNMKFTNTVTR